MIVIYSQTRLKKIENANLLANNLGDISAESRRISNKRFGIELNMSLSILVKPETRTKTFFRISGLLDIDGLFYSKSFWSSPSKISYRNNTDIVWRRPISGLDFRPEVENITFHNFRDLEITT